MVKFVFFGTPKFATMILEKLTKSGLKPAAVFRDTKESVSVLTEKLKDLKPDLAIIAAYGKILPKEILEIPRLGFINVHPSLLPKYRGASPIQSAILNSEKETGVTIMKIDEEMDHGPVVAYSKLPIANGDNYESLSKKLAILGAELLIKILPDYVSGSIVSIEQEHSKATYTKIIKKEDGKIDWRKSADEIERMTRAYYPWPSAYAKLKIKNEKFKIIKIIETEPMLQYSDVSKYSPGKIFLTENKELAVKCGKDVLIIKKLQLEGGKILNAKEFLNGHKDFASSVLE